ncbi:MAG: hypothetical protein ABI042_12685 [Verrucomicrobiota bacterium]
MIETIKRVRDHAFGYLLFIGFVILAVWLVDLSKTGMSSFRWKEFSSAEGNFKMKFPQEPERKIVSGRMDDPRFQEVTFFTAMSGKTVFMAGFADDFNDTVRDFSISQRLDAAVEGAVINTQGVMKSISEKNILLKGYSGREIDLAGSGGDGRMRIYLVGNRRFILGVMGENIRFNKTTSKFLDSFELLTK